jgi:hypothetical protein
VEVAIYTDFITSGSLLSSFEIFKLRSSPPAETFTTWRTERHVMQLLNGINCFIGVCCAVVHVAVHLFCALALPRESVSNINVTKSVRQLFLAPMFILLKIMP